MGNYLIGKCYHICDKGVDSLMYIGSSLDFGWYYIGQRLVKSSTKGVGYFTDTDILNFERTNLVEVDPIIWNKIHKILNINTIACNIILQSCEEYESPTGYYVSISSAYYVSTSSTRMHYKLVEILEDSQILTEFSDNQACIKELKEDAIKSETMFITSRKWISPETYNRVKNNVKDTIEEIDNIWLTM